MGKNAQTAKIEERWQRFAKEETLSSAQLEAFKRYAELLIEWNEKSNLTTVIELPSIISYHFQDSLRLARIVDVTSLSSIADVGAGGGFPGIPLAIKYPHLSVVLIEVSFKKIQFLDEIITTLNLGDRVSIYDKDWRTFLRITDFEIDLFCARASLQPEELLRMFKPSSSYRATYLVYWASHEWEPSAKVAPFIQKEASYKVGNRHRRLILIEKK